MPKKTPPPPSYLDDLHSFDYEAFFARCWRGEATEDDEQQYALRLASYFIVCTEQGKPIPEWVMREIQLRLWGWINGAPIGELFFRPGDGPTEKAPPRSSQWVQAVNEWLAENPGMKTADALKAVAERFHVTKSAVDNAVYAPKPWNWKP